jgi:predicted small integral membrane protein
MKILTKHILIFAFLMAVYTLAFRIGLSYCIGHEAWLLLAISSTVYGVAIFFTARFLAKAEGQEHPFFDLGLRFHLTSYLISAAVSLGWFYLGNPNQYEHVTDILRIFIYWGFILIIHTVIFLITRKDTIRGIRKDQLFEE